MKIKICGITNASDAIMCEDLGADALGFVHFPSSIRSLSLRCIREIVSTVGPFTKKVLVCSPADTEEAIKFVKAANVDVIQLYNLDCEEIESIRSHGIAVIRAVKPTDEEIYEFLEVADALLFDSPVPGSGRAHDYSAIPLKLCRRAIIAGGLGIENVDLVRSMRPYAVDVSSGVEKSVGRKDQTLVSEFIRRCRSC
ncbi:MAG: phosphoribosylanthranilate isomerase [Methanomassiliicoccales archaeon]